MLDSDNREFDLKLRSVFKDAEEKVPSGVWDAVCAEMDASSRHTPVWKWAGAAFALAASIACAVLLIDRNMPVPAVDDTLEMTANVTVVPDSPDIEIPSAAAQTAQAYRAAAPVSAQASVATAREAEREKILSDHEMIPAEEIVQCTATGTKDSDKSTETVSSETSEPAALIPDDWTDDDIPEAGRRISLTVNASATGNDKDLSSIAGPMKTAPGISLQGSNTIIESGSSKYSIPFAAGIGARVALGSRFSIGTGLSYSYLARTFNGVWYDASGKSSGEISIGHYMHYLGIPVNGYYDIVSGSRLKFYVYLGCQADFCLSNKYQILNTSGTAMDKKVSSVQWSAGAGLGVEFLIFDKFGIYFDPGARYYFPCNQPKNLHTERPFNINFDIGFRYDF